MQKVENVVGYLQTSEISECSENIIVLYVTFKVIVNSIWKKKNGCLCIYTNQYFTMYLLVSLKPFIYEQ